MLSCIVGALLACGQSAAMHIAGPVGYAPQPAPQYAWNYATYAQPIQFVPAVVIIRRA
jgi:hypothetical protein